MRVQNLCNAVSGSSRDANVLELPYRERLLPCGIASDIHRLQESV